MIELREYQKKAVESLVAKVNDIINLSENGTCIFQSPTGSGKTVIVSQALKALVTNRKDAKRFSFIWVSVRMLHEQSKEKLEKYYEDDHTLKCSYFGELNDKRIGENEILFINWHSINKKDINIYVRDNELENDLSSIIQHTKEDGREIILVIDESHHTAGSEKSRELIEVISPKVALEVSATPHLVLNASEIVRIPLRDVKAEEMIKSEIAINPEFSTIIIGPQSADELVLGQALKKREELVRMYKTEKANINPLVLVQLPDKKSDMSDKKDEVVKIFKNKFNITEENGKLAVWLSEDKSETLANIEKNNNEVEVLIFKQAIALGWDCPRASILVIFRETKNFEFTIQTIGRIMRMPELRYYVKEPEINKGYVYTNLPSIDITEDYAKDYITIYEAKRDGNLYDEIALPSIFLKRQRERTRLSSEFVRIFLKVAKAKCLKAKINPKPGKIINPILADGKIEDIDRLGEVKGKGKISVALNDHEVQRRFDNFICDICSPYAPVDSSDRMKSALYQFMKNEFNLPNYDPRAQRIILGKGNIQKFVDVANMAKEKYIKEISKATSDKREKVEKPDWEVPALISYNNQFTRSIYQKSVMKPLYARKPSRPEIEFMEFLEKSDKVKWWFKNGEGEQKYYAVLYQEDGIDRSFYIDFIVKFENGEIGLFDTKSGIYAQEATGRAKGLFMYLSRQRKRGKKIFGGIVIKARDSWRYNDQAKYKYDPNDLSNWKFLDN